MPAILTPLPAPDPSASRKERPRPRALAPLLFTDAANTLPQVEKPSFSGLGALPSWAAYAELEASDFPSCWPKPLSLLPAMDERAPAPFTAVPSLIPDEQEQTTAARMEDAAAALPLDYTDEDLYQAFAPIIENALRNSLDGYQSGIDPQLEPMLRATIRRALAEYTPGQRPFRAPGSFDRFLWRMQALFSSRSYEDILFEKTHRFQVEEVYTLDLRTLALVSYASCDPARHSSAQRVQGMVQRLALQVRDEEGNVRPQIALPDHRMVISRSGQHLVLMVIIRGPSNDLVISDLDFSLRRIEERFREQLETEGVPLLHELQPFLEDCLLIQAPASAA